VENQITNKKELTDFSKNQLALFFYNNSNNVAILLPQRAFKRRKAFIYGLFHGCECSEAKLILTKGAKITFPTSLSSSTIKSEFC